MGATPTSRAPGSVRLLTFNIRQGGRSRMDAITDTILRHEPDIAVITEFRASTDRQRAARRRGVGATAE